VSDYQKRITATFLNHCSPDKAYEWLSTNWRSPEGARASLSERWELERERKVLEYLLLSRKNPLIDLGLAQFGCTPYVLRTVFARGGAGVRCAVLANPLLFDSSLLREDSVINLRAIIKRGNRRELEALALNAHLPDAFYEHLINRTEYFAELSELDYKFMLYRLGDNARLSTPYDDTYLDGWDDYKYHGVFTAAWQLSATVPTTQEWAAVLVHLLYNAQLPVGFKDVEHVIERWRIDAPKKEDDRYYNPGYGFDLRSRLADLLEADERLLNSPDLALRRSFYRRFSPWKFKNWPEFLEKDGEEFVQEAVRGNFSLWKTAEERDRLRQVAWDCPDPHSDMMVPNIYRGREKSLRKEHPEWFYDKDDEHSADPSAVARRIEKLLKSIDEKLENLSVGQKRSPKKWWK
jgi:hypothetical protein